MQVFGKIELLLHFLDSQCALCLIINHSYRKPQPFISVHMDDFYLLLVALLCQTGNRTEQYVNIKDQ